MIILVFLVKLRVTAELALMSSVDGRTTDGNIFQILQEGYFMVKIQDATKPLHILHDRCCGASNVTQVLAVY